MAACVVVAGTASAKPSPLALLNGIAVGPDHNVRLAWWYGGPMLQIQTIQTNGAQVNIGPQYYAPGSPWQYGNIAVGPNNTVGMGFALPVYQYYYAMRMNADGTLASTRLISRHMYPADYIIDTKIDSSNNLDFLLEDSEYGAHNGNTNQAGIDGYSPSWTYIGNPGIAGAQEFTDMAIRHDGLLMYLEYDLPPATPYDVRVQSYTPGSQSPSTLAYASYVGGWRPTGITATPNNHFQIYFTAPMKTGDGLWRTALRFGMSIRMGTSATLQRTRFRGGMFTILDSTAMPSRRLRSTGETGCSMLPGITAMAARPR